MAFKRTGIILLLFIFLLPGCGKKESKEVRIGVLTTSTGESAQYGESVLSGIELAVLEINSKGGIDGKRIVLLIEDDASDPTRAVSAFTKLATIDKVPVIIGPISSSAAMACSPAANRFKVVLFSPSAATPAFTSYDDYTFRNRVSSDFEITSLAQYAFTKLGLRRVAILYVRNDYGLGNLAPFRSEFEKLGGQIPVVQAFDEGANDLRAQLSVIKRSKPDGIFLVGQGTEGGYALRQARELGIQGQFLSTITIERDDVLKIAGNSANSVIFTTPAYGQIFSSNALAFDQAYRSLYHQGSDMFSGNGYDALYIVSKAIESGGYSANGIRKALLGIKNFPGVTGETSIDSNGDVTKPECIMKIEDGKFKEIGH